MVLKENLNHRHAQSMAAVTQSYMLTPKVSPYHISHSSLCEIKSLLMAKVMQRTWKYCLHCFSKAFKAPSYFSASISILLLQACLWRTDKRSSYSNSFWWEMTEEGSAPLAVLNISLREGICHLWALKLSIILILTLVLR